MTEKPAKKEVEEEGTYKSECIGECTNCGKSLYLKIPNGIRVEQYLSSTNNTVICPRCKCCLQKPNCKFERLNIWKNWLSIDKKDAEELKKFNANPDNFYKKELWCLNCREYFYVKIQKGKSWKEAIREGSMVCTNCGCVKEKRTRWYRF